MSLESLPNAYRAAVFGAGGGLGSALVNALCADRRCVRVYAGSRRAILKADDKVRAFHFTLEEERSIGAAADALSLEGPLHLVVVATGMLHEAEIKPEKSWRSLDPASMQRAFVINTIGPALIGKHMLGLLASDAKSVFAALSARVGSISDNRLGGWHAYRASKAALNMLIRTFAIELAARNKAAICVGLHPGTVQTALSKPFLGRPTAARIFTPEHSVDRLLEVIDRMLPAHSGRLIAWDGLEIPF